MTLNVFLSAGRALELYVYVPFFSVSVHVPGRCPSRSSPCSRPGPTSMKFCVFDESVTTIVYLPALQRRHRLAVEPQQDEVVADRALQHLAAR